MVPDLVKRAVMSAGVDDRTQALHAATGAVCIKEHGSCTPPELAALVAMGFNAEALKRGVFLT